ncbi:UNVERIFIED_ORG: hypothetical protein J2W85_002385 [Ensifer adhaerens]|nr:hypothetical protein [Ensifer adhaerens]
MIEKNKKRPCRTRATESHEIGEHHLNMTSSDKVTPTTATEEDGDVIYTADLKVCATVYIRARNIVEARTMLSSLERIPLYATGDNVGESSFTDWFPEIEISETMTIHGQFDGDELLPRYDLANDIDYG